MRIATGTDKDGADFSATMERLEPETGTDGLAVQREAPLSTKDWNEVLLPRGAA